jgi:hypothetical protein
MKGKDLILILLAAVLAFIVMAVPTFAAVGCDLNDPDRDVARFFPESSGYKTTYVSIDKRGGEAMLRRVEKRLGDRFHGIYETIDVPYTLYEIHSGPRTIGYIHGVNQKGQFGGIQVFVALDPGGRIKSFYIQKMTSQWAKKLRDPKFGRQFAGLSLRDLDAYNPATGKGGGKVAEIRNPAPEAEEDFRASLRALKKNLILMDEFVFSAERGKP